jgi:hypothetical protein
MVYKLPIKSPKHVKIPRSEAPLNLCWETWHGVDQSAAIRLGIDPLEHCTKLVNHDGQHTWERVEAKRKAN